MRRKTTPDTRTIVDPDGTSKRYERYRPVMENMAAKRIDNPIIFRRSFVSSLLIAAGIVNRAITRMMINSGMPMPNIFSSTRESNKGRRPMPEYKGAGTNCADFKLRL